MTIFRTIFFEANSMHKSYHTWTRAKRKLSAYSSVIITYLQAEKGREREKYPCKRSSLLKLLQRFSIHQWTGIIGTCKDSDADFKTNEVLSEGRRKRTGTRLVGQGDRFFFFFSFFPFFFLTLLCYNHLCSNTRISCKTGERALLSRKPEWKEFPLVGFRASKAVCLIKTKTKQTNKNTATTITKNETS